jgi:methionyl-tRNA formyltransferase
MKLSAPAVKQAAIGLKLPVYQPSKVRNGELQRWLHDQAVDAAVVAAYGRILPVDVLSTPRCGCINLHASILPSYRGAAPIQWAIMDGQSETGISLMQMDEGMDTGPVYGLHRLSIDPCANAGDLALSLAELAAEVVHRDLLEVLQGKRSATPQNSAVATLAPPIEREHTLIDWTRSAIALSNQVRGLAPRPGALTHVDGKRLKVLKARAIDVGTDAPANAPGTVVATGPGGVSVCCGGGQLLIEHAQLEGRRAQAATDLVNGRALRVGSLLAGPPAP